MEQFRDKHRFIFRFDKNELKINAEYKFYDGESLLEMTGRMGK